MCSLRLLRSTGIPSPECAISACGTTGEFGVREFRRASSKVSECGASRARRKGRSRPVPAHLGWPAPPPRRAGGPRRPGRADLVRWRTGDRQGPLRPAGRRSALRRLGDRPVTGHPSPPRHPPGETEPPPSPARPCRAPVSSRRDAAGSNSLRKLVQPLRDQPRQPFQGGLRAVRLGGEDDFLAALDAEAEDGQHRGGVDRGGVRLGDGHGDAGGGGGPDEDGSGTGVQALGPADVDAALSHVEAALHESDGVV